VLAIIVARGGSKRIPGKNIRPFNGQPIIAYTIRAAIDSGCFSETMVSTDDRTIASIAESLGAAVPFLRSAAASTDTASTADAVGEVLNQYARVGRHFDVACCLYPAAPLMTAESIRKVRDLLLADPSLASAMPVVPFTHPIERALRIADGRLMPVQPEHLSTRTQDLQPSYHDAAQFYWFRVEEFMRSRRLITDRTGALVLPQSDAQDIDTEDDWLLAELKYTAIRARV